MASQILNIQLTSSEKEHFADTWKPARFLSIIKIYEMDISKLPVPYATRKQPLFALVGFLDWIILLRVSIIGNLSSEMVSFRGRELLMAVLNLHYVCINKIMG